MIQAAEGNQDVSTVSATRIRIGANELAAVSALSFSSQNLIPFAHNQLSEIFNSTVIESSWRDAQESLRDLGIQDHSKGVNAGDCKAIFYLIKAFQPKRVLEIGTHVGSSTLHIAKALCASGTLVTVDIRDVNDSIQRNWENFGSSFSPRELTARLGLSEKVSFQTCDSLEFLRHSRESFDFIFLDGDHRASKVYQEIAAALKCLNPGGIILLHDFFPNLSSLWNNKPVIPGPCLAVERCLAEGANIKVLPLGGLPWVTKLNSSQTSLALLCKNQHQNPKAEL